MESFSVPRIRTRRVGSVTSIAALVIGVVAACGGLDDRRETRGTNTNVLPAGVPIVMHPAQSGTLALQVVDAVGNGANGVSVVFVRPEAHALSFDGHEATEDSISVVTGNATAFGVRADGIAVANVTIAADAVPGTTSVFAGFVAAPSVGGTFARIDIQIVPIVPDAGGADAGMDGSAADAAEDAGAYE